MVKKVLALCDKEENYLYHMADYLEKNDMQPFEIRAFSNIEQLKKFVNDEETELLIIAENVYEEEVENFPVTHILILNESGNKVGNRIENINKYQSSECIFRAVMNSYTGGVENVSQRIASGKRMKIIGNYTPVSHCLQTTFALSMGQILAKKHKTLYLNFEAYSGLRYLLNQEFSTDITDVLYYFHCEKEKLAYRLRGMVQSLNGLDYIPPVLSYRDLDDITGEKWIELFQQIERDSDYEYLILDLSEQMKGLFDVLRACFRVFTIVREDSFAEAKLKQYESIMQSMNYEDVAVKTKKWNLPMFHKIPTGLDQLTHGEIAGYVKKIVEEEIYGYQG